MIVTCFIIAISSYPLVYTVLITDSIDYRISYFIVTSYVLACFLALIYIPFFIFNLRIINNQYTTIEFIEKKGRDELFMIKSPYDLGTFKNFQTILGYNPLLWFLPICPNNKG